MISHLVVVVAGITACLGQGQGGWKSVTHEWLRSITYMNPNKSQTYTIGILNFMSGSLFEEFNDLPSCSVLSINEINKRMDILPNHNLVPIFKDTIGQRKVAMRRAHALVNNNWTGVVTPPIAKTVAVIGAWRSVCSMLSGFVFELKHTPQLSVSTSVELSDKKEFPYFSRLIGNDALQGAAIAAVCKYYGWLKVAVLFTSDSYSSSITLAFIAAGKKIGVESVVSISFITNSLDPLTTQINLIRASKATVIYSPVVAHDLKHAMKEFSRAGMTVAPYVWLGADGWGSTPDIPIGALATAPWSPTPVAGQSKPINEFDRLWKIGVSKNMTAGVRNYSFFCPYQYDMSYHVAYALDGLPGNVSECQNAVSGDSVANSPVCKQYYKSGNKSGGALLELIRRLSWTGATGLIELNHTTGDRDTAWTLTNKNAQGKVVSVGTITITNGIHTFQPAGPTVYWPSGSSQVPRSFPELIITWDRIPTGLFAGVSTFCGLAIVICFVCMAFAYRYRERTLMRLSSWRINNVTTFGIIISLVATILFGIDENISGANTNMLCVARPWLLDLGFNIFFLPLFAKTYRVNKIFNMDITKVVVIPDLELLTPVFVFCIVDVIILSVWSGVDPLRREVVTGTPVENLATQTLRETRFSVCTSRNTNAFYLTLVLLKAIPCVYGGLMAFQTRHVYIDAMRDSTQIGAILIFVVLVGAFEVAISFVIRNPTAEYVLLSCGVLVVSGAALGLVWGDKFYAIYMGAEDSMTERKIRNSTAGAEQSQTSGSKKPSIQQTLSNSINHSMDVNNAAEPNDSTTMTS